MATHRVHAEVGEAYFCTITCHEWLPLFEEAQAYESVYNWFRHLTKADCRIHGYVIMPNHIHVVLNNVRQNSSLNQLVAEGKRFMAYDIVRNLMKMNKTTLLSTLAVGVDANELRKGKKHQVFKPSFDARTCDNERMLLKRLEYMHSNPLKGKWSLVTDFTAYPHSSAVCYELGIDQRGVLTHYRDVG